MRARRRTKSRVKSVTVFFQGGLGNQLFQLAAGLDVAEGDSSRLILDFTLLKRSGTSRSPEILDLVCQDEFLATYRQRKFYVLPLLILRSASLRIKEIRSLASRFGVITEGKLLDPAILLQARNTNSNKYLLGYFHHADAAMRVTNELTEVLKIERLFISHNIKSNYLFMHLRRGDYLKYRNSYGVISDVDVIKTGISAIREFSINGVYVASEDCDAATRITEELKPLLKWNELVPLDSSGIDILRIMLSAEVLVLANSSLSWWGAFLNLRNALVYYPDPWFKSFNQPDFILPAWNPYKVNWV